MIFRNEVQRISSHTNHRKPSTEIMSGGRGGGAHRTKKSCHVRIVVNTTEVLQLSLNVNLIEIFKLRDSVLISRTKLISHEQKKKKKTIQKRKNCIKIEQVYKSEQITVQWVLEVMIRCKFLNSLR